MAKNNPFDALLQSATKTLEFEGITIKYRELSIGEDDAFNLRLVNGFKEIDGEMKPNINMKEANAIKYEKVSKMLVEPKMSVADLKALPKSIASRLFEELLSTDDDELVDAEGN